MFRGLFSWRKEWEENVGPDSWRGGKRDKMSLGRRIMFIRALQGTAVSDRTENKGDLKEPLLILLPISSAVQCHQGKHQSTRVPTEALKW